MEPLREYTVTVNGMETTMLLDEHDAARMGARLLAEPEPAAEPAVAELAPEPDIKARPAQNKARLPRDKAGS